MDPDILRDLFSSFRPITVRRMFGGAGLYADGVMFALWSSGGTLYLKVDDINEPDFQRENLPSFAPVMKSGRHAVMPFRQMPDRLYDEPDELAQWAARALAAAQRQKRVPARSPRAKAVKRKGKTRSKAAETR
jgi:DNA transformation protein